MLTCSKDFSIRVYRWANIQSSGPTTAGVAAASSKPSASTGEAAASKLTTSKLTANKPPNTAEAAASKPPAQLESKYTLLGGSVALKTQ